MSKKVKYTLEYPVRCSPVILYDFLSSQTGLQEWFADKVEERDGTDQRKKKRRSWKVKKINSFVTIG
jgi:hypothetical protein